MEIGIVGLPDSGKTTIFNALARGKAPAGSGTGAHVGVVKVPDPRLDALAELLRPKRTVPAETTYVDVAVPADGLGKQSGPRGQFLSQLSNVDALIHVVRTFESDTVPHVEGSVDPQRDIGAMNMELAFSDMAVIERRLGRLRDSLKGAKQQERDAILREQSFLTGLKDALEQDIPIREQELSEQGTREIESFQFLTAKPMLLLLNIGENQIPRAASIERKFGERHRRPAVEVLTICGQIEMELAQLEEPEAADFRSSLGLNEPGLDRVIRTSYALLGLISFFTTASDELRAWTVRRNTTVQKAAGKIHSDMERGFIRAEVVSYEDLVACGGMAEARKRGLVRLEGKNHIVQDGDVVTILFNV